MRLPRKDARLEPLAGRRDRDVVDLVPPVRDKAAVRLGDHLAPARGAHPEDTVGVGVGRHRLHHELTRAGHRQRHRPRRRRERTEPVRRAVHRERDRLVRVGVHQERGIHRDVRGYAGQDRQTGVEAVPDLERRHGKHGGLEVERLRHEHRVRTAAGVGVAVHVVDGPVENDRVFAVEGELIVEGARARAQLEDVAQVPASVVQDLPLRGRGRAGRGAAEGLGAEGHDLCIGTRDRGGEGARRKPEGVRRHVGEPALALAHHRHVRLEPVDERLPVLLADARDDEAARLRGHPVDDPERGRILGGHRAPAPVRAEDVRQETPEEMRRRRAAHRKRRKVELVVREERVHLPARAAERAGETGPEGGERERVRPVVQPRRKRPRVGERRRVHVRGGLGQGARHERVGEEWRTVPVLDRESRRRQDGREELVGHHSRLPGRVVEPVEQDRELRRLACQGVRRVERDRPGQCHAGARLGEEPGQLKVHAVLEGRAREHERHAAARGRREGHLTPGAGRGVDGRPQDVARRRIDPPAVRRVVLHQHPGARRRDDVGREAAVGGGGREDVVGAVGARDVHRERARNRPRGPDDVRVAGVLGRERDLREVGRRHRLRVVVVVAGRQRGGGDRGRGGGRGGGRRGRARGRRPGRATARAATPACDLAGRRRRSA